MFSTTSLVEGERANTRVTFDLNCVKINCMTTKAVKHMLGQGGVSGKWLLIAVALNTLLSLREDKDFGSFSTFFCPVQNPFLGQSMLVMFPNTAVRVS